MPTEPVRRRCAFCDQALGDDGGDLPMCSRCYSISRAAVMAAGGGIVPETGGTQEPPASRGPGLVGEARRSLDPEERTRVFDFFCTWSGPPWADRGPSLLTTRALDEAERPSWSGVAETMLERAQVEGWRYPVPWVLPMAIGPFRALRREQADAADDSPDEVDPGPGEPAWEPPPGGPRAAFARDRGRAMGMRGPCRSRR